MNKAALMETASDLALGKTAPQASQKPAGAAEAPPPASDSAQPENPAGEAPDGAGGDPQKRRKIQRRAHTTEIIRIHELLKKHIEVIGEGRCRYLNGMNDGKIAQIVAADLHEKHVGRIRAQMFGHLNERRPEEEIAELKQRVRDLEITVSVLEKRIVSLSNGFYHTSRDT